MSDTEIIGCRIIGYEFVKQNLMIIERKSMDYAVIKNKVDASSSRHCADHVWCHAALSVDRSGETFHRI